MYTEMNTIPMQEQGIARGSRCTEGTDFHWIGDGGSSERGVWARVVITLGRYTGVFVFVQLLCPASRLLSDQVARGPRKAGVTVWGL